MASKTTEHTEIHIAAVFAVCVTSHSKTQVNIIEKDRFLDTDDIFIIIIILSLL